MGCSDIISFAPGAEWIRHVDGCFVKEPWVWMLQRDVPVWVHRLPLYCNDRCAPNVQGPAEEPWQPGRFMFACCALVIHTYVETLVRSSSEGAKRTCHQLA